MAQSDWRLFHALRIPFNVAGWLVAARSMTCYFIAVRRAKATASYLRAACVARECASERKKVTVWSRGPRSGSAPPVVGPSA